MGNRENYALLGIFIGLVFGGLVGYLLYWVTHQSGFLWLPLIGLGLGLWLGTLVERSRFRPRQEPLARLKSKRPRSRRE